MTDTQQTPQTPQTPPAPATTSAPAVSPPPAASVAKVNPVLVNRGTHVLMHNPATGGTWAAPVDYADQALADGWEFAPDPATEEVGTDVADALNELAAEQAPPVEAEPTGWDPDEHTADEVNAYIAEMLATQRGGEAARVYAVEQDGQNRKSVKDPTNSLTGDPVGA